MHRRFFADKGVFVVVEPYTAEERKVQMLDISEGGCAFIYNGSKEELEKIGLLSLQSKDIPYLERIDFVTKSDKMAGCFRPEKAQGVYQTECHWPCLIIFSNLFSGNKAKIFYIEHYIFSENYRFLPQD